MQKIKTTHAQHMQITQQVRFAAHVPNSSWHNLSNAKILSCI